MIKALPLLLAIVLVACSDDESSKPVSVKELTKQPQSKQVTEEIKTPGKLSYSITQDSLGYGYQILLDSVLYINQPNIPAIQGRKGFSSSEKAEIAAQFVIHKLENNILPPSVTLKELDSLSLLE